MHRIALAAMFAALLLAAVPASPVFAADDPACAANRAAILAAMEGYLALGREAVTVIDLRMLVGEGLLPSEPACPGGGVYATRLDFAGDGAKPVASVSCALHRADGPGGPGTPQGPSVGTGADAGTGEAALSAAAGAAIGGDEQALDGAARAPVDPRVALAACGAQKTQIFAAANLLLMEDESGPAPDISVEILVEKGHLQTAPVCPEGGAYSVRVAENEAGGAKSVDVECSLHR